MQTTRETIEREEDSGSSRPTDMMEPVINRNSEVAALTDGTQRKKKKKTFYLLSRRAKTLSAPFLFAVGLGAYVCLYIFHAGVVEDGRDRGPLHDLLYIWIFILVLLTQWLRARTDGAGMPGGNERLALQENVGSSPFFLSLLLRLLRTPFPIHLHQKDPSSYSSDVLKYMQEEGEDAPPKAQSSFVYLYSWFFSLATTTTTGLVQSIKISRRKKGESPWYVFFLNCLSSSYNESNRNWGAEGVGALGPTFCGERCCVRLMNANHRVPPAIRIYGQGPTDAHPDLEAGPIGVAQSAV